MRISKEKLTSKVRTHSECSNVFFYNLFSLVGDVLEVIEQRQDWANMHMTPELFKYVFTRLIPEVIVHSQSQDEEQVRDHYDRGDDFYEWYVSSCLSHQLLLIIQFRFLGPRMVYTSGIIPSSTQPNTLEELQDTKLAVVCEKLDLQPTDRLLDIGCGWGTLTAFAAKNYGCDVTGITLGRNQTAFGNNRIKENGVSPEKARILCMDYREIPGGSGHYNKIVSLEMAEVIKILSWL